jgi:hypothetical protein
MRPSGQSGLSAEVWISQLTYSSISKKKIAEKLTLGHDAIVCFLEKPVIGKRVRYPREGWFDQLILGWVIEALESIRELAGIPGNF